LILKLISDSRERTLEMGRLIGAILERGDIVALIGELGSGKTCLTQGLA
jgi:tRNA threonylcarbamoyladenosine biosynthesis protein TsaE